MKYQLIVNGTFPAKNIIAVVNPDTELKVLERKGKWLRVVFIQNKKTMTGWIQEQDIEIIE